MTANQMANQTRSLAASPVSAEGGDSRVAMRAEGKVGGSSPPGDEQSASQIRRQAATALHLQGRIETLSSHLEERHLPSIEQKGQVFAYTMVRCLKQFRLARIVRDWAAMAQGREAFADAWTIQIAIFKMIAMLQFLILVVKVCHYYMKTCWWGCSDLNEILIENLSELIFALYNTVLWFPLLYVNVTIPIKSTPFANTLTLEMRSFVYSTMLFALKIGVQILCYWYKMYLIYNQNLIRTLFSLFFIQPEPPQIIKGSLIYLSGYIICSVLVSPLVYMNERREKGCEGRAELHYEFHCHHAGFEMIGKYF